MTTAKPEPLSPLRSVQGSGLLMIVSEFSDSTKLDISRCYFHGGDLQKTMLLHYGQKVYTSSLEISLVHIFLM